MEIDRGIALFVREQRKQEEEEQLRSEREKYDPKKQITYTLEELTARGKKGKAVFIYSENVLRTQAGIWGKVPYPFYQGFL